MISLLLPGPYSQLTYRLGLAVAKDPSLAAARAQLLLPLDLLNAMAQEAEGTLGNDPRAAERLRLLISVAAPHALPSSTSAALTEGKSSKARSATADPPLPTTAPGLIHQGVLVIVALAAGRAGAPVKMGAQFVRTVLGLALSASPAETLVQLAGPSLSDDQLRALLAALAPTDGRSSSMGSALATFLSDPAQRARWTCIATLLGEAAKQVDELPWDGTASAEILAVTPPDACPGKSVQLTARLEDSEWAELDDDGSSAVFFVAATGETLPAKISKVDEESGSVTASVPKGARNGWIGLALPSRLERTNTARKRLRSVWAGYNKQAPCLANAPVPVEAIPLLPDPAAPTAAAGNRFIGGLPAILGATISPEVVEPGGKVTITWATDGAREVKLAPEGQVLGPEGKVELDVPEELPWAAYTLIATNACGEEKLDLSSRVRLRIAEVRAAPEGGAFVEGRPVEVRVRFKPVGAEPWATLKIGETQLEGELVSGDELSPPELRFQIPSALAKNGLTGTVALAKDDGSPADDTKDVGPLAMATVSQRRLVVVRPAVFSPGFTRVSDTQLREAITAAERALNLTLAWQEPLWVGDEDLTVSGVVDSAESPGVSGLLDRLSRMAAAQPGLEDATWVALLPTWRSGSQMPVGPLSRRVSAEAARAVAVATTDALIEVLRDGAQPVPEPPSAPPPVVIGLARRPVHAVSAFAAFASTLPATDATASTSTSGASADPGPVTPRLRLVGSLWRDGRLDLLEGTRVERRAAGAGAEIDTGVDVVGLDADGNEQVVRRLKGVRAGWPITWVALLPVSDAIATIEFRFQDSLLAKLDRLADVPSLDALSLGDGAGLSWKYDHPAGAQPIVSVELAQGAGWCPVALPGPCDRNTVLPLHRLTPAFRRSDVRVVASDGWNAAALVAGAIDLPRRHVAARPGGQNRYWADTEDGGTPTWTLDTQTFQGSAIQLPPGARGTLTLTVIDDGEAFTDAIEIGGGDASA